MQRLIIRRLITAVLVMLTASLLSFTLLFFAPGNPAEAILRMQSGEDPNFIEIQMFMENHNLNRTYATQSLQWLYMVSRGDLGASLRTGEPVIREFLDRFGATAQLALTAVVISTLIALLLGVFTAVRQNSLLDHATRLLALAGMSIPEFWLGVMLMIFFSMTLRWLPSYGYGTAKHLVMPVIALSAGMSASLMRLTRASMLDALHQDYVTMARAKGLREKLVIWKHALKNALIPVVTLLGSQFGHLLAGTVVVETVFSWPGIGKYLIDSIYARDYPVIQGFVLIIAVIFVLINLLVDISYAYLDPRIRYEQGRG